MRASVRSGRDGLSIMEVEKPDSTPDLRDGETSNYGFRNERVALSAAAGLGIGAMSMLSLPQVPENHPCDWELPALESELTDASSPDYSQHSEVSSPSPSSPSFDRATRSAPLSPERTSASGDFAAEDEGKPYINRSTSPVSDSFGSTGLSAPLSPVSQLTSSLGGQSGSISARDLIEVSECKDNLVLMQTRSWDHPLTMKDKHLRLNLLSERERDELTREKQILEAALRSSQEFSEQTLREQEQDLQECEVPCPQQALDDALRRVSRQTTNTHERDLLREMHSLNEELKRSNEWAMSTQEERPYLCLIGRDDMCEMVAEEDEFDDGIRACYPSPALTFCNQACFSHLQSSTAGTCSLIYPATRVVSI